MSTDSHTRTSDTENGWNPDVAQGPGEPTLPIAIGGVIDLPRTIAEIYDDEGHPKETSSDDPNGWHMVAVLGVMAVLLWLANLNGCAVTYG